MKKSANKIIHKVLLFSILHSSLVAPCQDIVIDYFNQTPSIKYKGSSLKNIKVINYETPENISAPLKQSNKVNFVQNDNIENDIVNNAASSSYSIKTDISYGVIGVSKENPLDNPSDNLFKFILNELPNTNTKVYLSYELNGVQDNIGVSRSINDRLATGGYIVKQQQGWTSQKEEISLEWLQNGENKIMFSIPKGANFQYQVKNVKILIENNEAGVMQSSLVIDNPDMHFIKNDKMYVRGFIRNIKSDNVKVYVEDNLLSFKDGEFEGFIKLTESLKNRKFIVVKALADKELIGQEIISLDNLIEADRLFSIETSLDKASAFFKANNNGVLKTDGASVIINANSLSTEKELSIMKLRNIDIAPMGSGMINVTKGGYGYRFLPDGIKFDNSIAISIEYDEKLIPKGYNPDDIKTYYFDTNSKSWIAVKRESLNENEKVVKSLTNHFTDYINGIIQTPESPETVGFTPTMMNDIKAADPSSEMTIISPPEVSQKGDANVSYPIKIPAGRKGVQPQLAIQYNNEAGTGWLGQGWNINVPSINIDTRWGVPLLDATYETEIYTLGGEQLMYPKIGVSDWMPNRHYDASGGSLYNTAARARITNAVFTPRKQGSFAKIERLGTNPNTYYWKVTSSDGTINWYGGKTPADVTAGNAVIKNFQGAIVQWALFMTEDVHKNNIKYTYTNANLPSQTGNFENLTGGRIFNINNITYTGYNDAPGKYKVEFINETSILRKDLSINARLGLKQVEPYRLSKIKVSYDNSLIRSYNLTYVNGIFDKSLLSEITELDANNNVFYSHKLDYYEEDLMVKGKLTLYGQPYTVSVPSISPDFTLGIGNLLGASRINASDNTETEWGVRPAVGIDLFRASSNPAFLFTIGAPFGESHTDGKGKITMIDMDGNGLEDVVFKKNNMLKYLPHFVDSNNSHYFDSAPRNILNINNFQKSSGWTKTMFGESWDINALWKFYAGTKRFKSSEDTSIYFTDGNGDGLPDIVNDNKVYFNRVDPNNGDVVFETSSALTPNMLITANVSEITPDTVPDENPETVSQTDYDVVRVWESPEDMKVTITDTPSFSPESEDSKITYSIETSYNGETPHRLYLKEFTYNDTSDNIVLPSMTIPPLGFPEYLGNTFPARRGQKFYFRIHKNKTGKNDRLKTNPTIAEVAYSSPTPPLDQNNYPKLLYKYSDDFVLSNQSVSIPAAGNIAITWPTMNIANQSDDLHYKIIKVTNSLAGVTEQVLFTRDCPMGVSTSVTPTALISNYNIGTITEDETVEIQFVVNADSNVRWTTAQWKPKLVYTPSSSSAVAFTRYPVPNYSMFFCTQTNSHYTIGNFSDKVLPNITIHPSCPSTLLLQSTDNGSFLFVVKKNGLAIGKRKVIINNGVISLDSNTPIDTQNPTIEDKITHEFYVDGAHNFTIFNKYSNAVSFQTSNNLNAGNVIIGTNAEWSSYPVSDFTHFNRIPATTIGNNTKQHLGAMHRNWGQFLYNDDLDTDATIPHDIHGKLINSSIVDNPVGNSLDLMASDLGISLSNCASTDPEATQACSINAINAALNLPPVGDINSDNLDAIIGALMNNPNLSSLSAQQMPFVPMTPFRNFVREDDKDVEIEKWIGFTDTQYSSPIVMRDGNLVGSALDQVVTDPTDIESTYLQGDLNTGMYALTKNHRNVARSYSAGWGSINVSKSTSSYSVSTTDFMDLNGDRYPDLYSSIALQYTTMTGGHKIPELHPWGDSNTSSSNNTAVAASKGYSLAGRKKADDDETQNDQGNPSASLGVGLSANLGGKNKEETYWMDVNGDGLTDKVINAGVYIYQLNKGKTFNPNGFENFSLLNSGETKPGVLTPSVSVSFGSNSGSIPYSVSFGVSRSTGNADVSFQDLNGDGLIDQLEVSGGIARVRYNNGNGFSATQEVLSFYTNKSLNENYSASLSGSASYFYGFSICCWILPIIFLKFGATGSASASLTVSDSHKAFKDFDGDGYNDFVQNDGTNLKIYPSNIKRTNKLKSVTNPLGGKFTIDYKVEKLDFNNPNPRWVMSQLTIDDGYDKINDGHDVYKKEFVYRNGKYDRRERDFYGFESVKTLDYKLDVDNGFSAVYRTTVSKYHNDSYFLNGLLKESYVLQGNDEAKVYSRTVNNYEIKQLDATNNKLSVPLVTLPNNYDVGGKEGRRSAAVVMTSTRNYLYELSPTPLLTTEIKIGYDEKARVGEYLNSGDTNNPNDDYKSKITYHTSTNLVAKNIINVPKTIDVIIGSTAVRKRNTKINDNTGQIISITAKISSTEEAVTNMKYDTYGNLSLIEYPQNYNGQSMSYSYTYDSQNSKYVEVINDAFGHESKALYDPKFDKILQTINLAGNKMTYTYDSFGRNLIIRAPKEIAASKPYTLKFQYFPKLSDLTAFGVTANVDNFVPVALTKHYDQANPTNDIETITFIDGLGRPIQVKKDIQINTGTPESPTLVEAMNFSGKTFYDDFGRDQEQYHPYYEEKSNNVNFILNEYNSEYKSETKYDELDRPVETIDPDGNQSFMEYSIANDVSGTLSIKTKSRVEQNDNAEIISETYKDTSGKVISTMNEGPNGDIWTKFNYNAIGELLSYTDAENISTSYKYDLLGRRLFIENADNGVTSYQYDKAGNLLKRQTANLANDSTLDPANRFIKYEYEFNRIASILYPDTPSGQNISNVSYKYGEAGSGNEAGRLVHQQDATGTQDFKYGNMGEMIYNERTVVGPNIPTRIFKTSYEYDSWNRLRNLKYPDGENVSFYYDLGGNLTRMTGSLNELKYSYVSRVDYDYYEQRTYLLYGNKTETFYNYTPGLRRLNNLNVKTAALQNLFNNKYTYDKVGNVINLGNNATPTSNNMGGTYEHSFAYDKLNRLEKAEGKFEGSQSQQVYGNDFYSDYNLRMEYNNTHGIEHKSQNHYKNDATFAPNTYDNAYHYYEGTHKVLNITTAGTGFEEAYHYDTNGNMVTKFDTDGNHRDFLWDESNRLRVVAMREGFQHYIYDASGERVLKANTDAVEIYQNGTPVDQNHLSVNSYTTYPSALIVIDAQGVYSKHYYAGSQRVVSRIGDQDISIFDEECTDCKKDKNNKFDAKALQQSQIQDFQQRLDKAKLGKVTFKPFKRFTYEEIQKTITEENDEENGEINRPPAPPPPIYYYHPDHLGTSSALTDYNGVAYQFFLNLPFGETMAEQRPTTSYYNSPYKFNGKELDEETGLYYYGARYYDPKSSIWLSVDPLVEKYPDISPYVYCYNNPINAIDPDGRDLIFITGGEGGKPLRNFKYRKGNFYDIETGKRYNPGKEAVSKAMYKVLTAYRKIEKSNDKILKNQLHTLEKSELHHYIKEGDIGQNQVSPQGTPTSLEADARSGTVTFYNFSAESKKDFEESEGVINSDFSTVVHEMRHQYDREIGNTADNIDGANAEDPAEIRAVYNENRARKIEGLPKRTRYGTPINPKKLNSPPNNKNMILNPSIKM